MLTAEQREQFHTLLTMLEVQSREARVALTRLKFLDEARGKPRLVRADFMNGNQPPPEAQLDALMQQAGMIFNQTLAEALEFGKRLHELVAEVQGK